MPEPAIPLSVFIITKDEADRIEDAILSVKSFADEIIVVDSGSKDGTIEVAERAGATVSTNEFGGYGPQKCHAEGLCKNRWLFNIDADEPLTPELQDEISGLLKGGEITEHDAWRVPIKTIYPHEKKPASWAFTYNQIRLYDREKGGFLDSIVHDSVIMKEGASVGQLTAAIAHHSHRDITFQVDKMNRYADMQVQDLFDRGKQISKLRLITEFPLSFLKGYFIRRNFRYGFWGVTLSVNYAYSRFLRVAKFHEIQQNRAARDAKR